MKDLNCKNAGRKGERERTALSSSLPILWLWTLAIHRNPNGNACSKINQKKGQQMNGTYSTDWEWKYSVHICTCTFGIYMYVLRLFVNIFINWHAVEQWWRQKQRLCSYNNRIAAVLLNYTDQKSCIIWMTCAMALQTILDFSYLFVYTIYICASRSLHVPLDRTYISPSSSAIVIVAAVTAFFYILFKC